MRLIRRNERIYLPKIEVKPSSVYSWAATRALASITIIIMVSIWAKMIIFSFSFRLFIFNRRSFKNGMRSMISIYFHFEAATAINHLQTVYFQRFTWKWHNPFPNQTESKCVRCAVHTHWPSHQNVKTSIFAITFSSQSGGQNSCEKHDRKHWWNDCK